jgi:hypothetical protein
MKNIHSKSLLLFSVLLSSLAIGQKKYFQQEINYTIKVKLDDKKHVLHGYEEFKYTNNSPDILSFLYIHVWANAYSGPNTALGKQIYQNGEQLLRFGNDSVKGGIDSLAFQVNGRNVPIEVDSKNPDIIKLILNEPVHPGTSVVVSTPFRVKLPSGEISRLGHIGQSYQITQWYPKPAVYDRNGWNQIPYLNQGEFYSEYGTFDVSITLPKNYVIGATGDLQTKEEETFLNSRIALAEAFAKDNKIITGDWTAFPISSDTMKTVRFTQQKVHDFAWFADKRYLVQKGEVELPHSKRKVTTWAMFTPKNAALWNKATEYIHDGTYYYSLWNGDYPYNQVTAVDGTISAGGGMEYPNVTVIGNSSNPIELEIVIVHEVGHNWFYGILGSNERAHGWMDEGLNTLNEMRYMYTKYPNNTNLSDMILNGSFHFDHLSHYDSGDFMYRIVAGLGDDQPIETHSAEYSSINYGAIMYQKTGLVFNYLKAYLGDSIFDACMQTYFNEWKFKHPQPEDLKTTLERVSGKDLSWLFVDLIQTTNHIDYKLTKVRTSEGNTEVTVKNVGQVSGPIEVTGLQKGKPVQTIWIEPGSQKETVLFRGEMDEVRVNYSGKAPELYQHNNSWHKKGLFGKIESTELQFAVGKNVQNQTNLFWTPMLGGNAYDKFMLGVAVHNLSVPSARTRFLLVPMYSFGGQRISGIAELNRTFLPKRGIKMARLGLSLKSFKNDTLGRNDGYYVAVLPYWKAKLGNRNGSPFDHQLDLHGMYRLDVFGPSQRELVGGYLKYFLAYNRADHQLSIGARTDLVANPVNGDQFSRGTVEATYRYRYIKNKRSRWVELRVFGGNYFSFDMYNSGSTVNYTMALGGMSGGQDLFVEDYFFGRSALNGFYSQQRFENWGGFRSVAGNGMSGFYGLSNTWLAAANFYMETPIGPKIFGIYADFGIFDNGIPSGSNTAFNAGLAVRIRDNFGLYFPVAMSKDMENAFSSANYLHRIRFTLKFNLTDKWINISNLL